MSNWRKYESLLQVLGNKVNCEDKHGTASYKVNFNARRSHAERYATTPKKAVKLTARPELSDTGRICKLYFKIGVGVFTQ